MKQLKLTGLIVFLAGLVLFTAALFMGRFVNDKAIIQAHFDQTPQEMDKGDAQADFFYQAVNAYQAKNSVTISSAWAFNQHLTGIIAENNRLVAEAFLDKEGITETEKEAIQLIKEARELCITKHQGHTNQDKILYPIEVGNRYRSSRYVAITENLLN